MGSEMCIRDRANVDPEIATIPGPQLVVPIMNARFALNAANARWGSLYDALYGTDALGDLPSAGGYDAARGARVIAWAKGFLDDALPLQGASWSDVTSLTLDGSVPVLTAKDAVVSLKDAGAFEGARRGDGSDHYLFKNNGLRVEVVVDASSAIGASDAAGISDVRLESAMSTIMDCEDSVAAVDAEDKVLAYSNWLGLMKGDLEESFEKGGKVQTRRMAPNLTYTDASGAAFEVKTRALMLIRNVGHLMTNPAIQDRDGNEAVSYTHLTLPTIYSV